MKPSLIKVFGGFKGSVSSADIDSFNITGLDNVESRWIPFDLVSNIKETNGRFVCSITYGRNYQELVIVHPDSEPWIRYLMHQKPPEQSIEEIIDKLIAEIQYNPEVGKEVKRKLDSWNERFNS